MAKDKELKNKFYKNTDSKQSKSKFNKQKPSKGVDTRFNRAQYDPRFSEPASEHSSSDLLTDKRFNKIFEDDAFKEDYTVDEYGRPIKTNSAEFLAKYYKLSNNEINKQRKKQQDDLHEYGENEDEEAKDEVKVEDEEEDEEEADEDEDEDEEDEEEEDEDEDGDEEEEDFGEEIEDAMKRYLADADDDEDAQRLDDDEEVTRRIAIQNMDWSSIKAIDLLAVLKHFAPPGGIVKKVTIYPSELGKVAMAREPVSGPADIWKNTNEEQGIKKAYQGFDEHKLRRYEKNALRYYYAIAECDSVRTASHIYDTCDGMELEDSVNTFDLRFVPNDQKFSGQTKDTATVIPPDFKPSAVFTKALGHSVQKLTWDCDDPDREALLHTDYSKRSKLKDMTYEAFMEVMDDENHDDDDVERSEEKEEGSSDEEDSILNRKNKKKENGTAKSEEKEIKGKVEARNKYKDILKGLYDKPKKEDELVITFDQDVENIGSADVGSEEGEGEREFEFEGAGEEDPSMEREITFTPGLDEKAKAIIKEKEMKDLSDWDRYLKKKELRQKELQEAKREKAKAAQLERQEVIKGANVKTTEKKEMTEKEKKGREELELLFSGEKEVEKGFNMRQLVSEEKEKGRKGKKGSEKKGKEEKREQSNFTLKMDDNRFGAIYTDKNFAIDRSNPSYKSTAAMKAIEKESIVRRYDPKTGAPKQKEMKSNENSENWDARIQNLKRKVGDFPAKEFVKTKALKLL